MPKMTSATESANQLISLISTLDFYEEQYKSLMKHPELEKILVGCGMAEALIGGAISVNRIGEENISSALNYLKILISSHRVS